MISFTPSNSLDGSGYTKSYGQREAKKTHGCAGGAAGAEKVGLGHYARWGAAGWNQARESC